MAIFSLHHGFIGRTTHPAGSASLYARYIARPEACTEVIGQRMPTERRALMEWLDAQEQDDRKNARVIDKIVVALPLELTHDENVALLQAFGERMSQGRASWVAAIHDGPGDADNPHAHLIFRDRDVETGRRVMLTTEKGSTEPFREGWETEANIALELAGVEARIDRRSLKEHGIDREPQLHVGAGAKRLAEREYQFKSAEKEITRLVDSVPQTVTVNYPAIDEGRTRFEENEARKQRNFEREMAEMQEAMRAGYPRDAPSAEAGRFIRMVRTLEAGNRLDALYAETRRIFPDKDGDDDPVAATVQEHREARDPVQGRGVSGATDAVAGAGLAFLGRLSDMAESLLDSPAPIRPGDEPQQEHSMADKPIVQRQQLDEQRHRFTEAELEKFRSQELDAYLKQRDRERHIDRGR
jgi:hypothetical protein